MLLIPSLGRQRQSDSWAWLVSQTNQIDEFQARERPCFKTQAGQHPEQLTLEVDYLPPHIHHSITHRGRQAHTQGKILVTIRTTDEPRPDRSDSELVQAEYLLMPPRAECPN